MLCVISPVPGAAPLGVPGSLLGRRAHPTSGTGANPQASGALIQAHPPRHCGVPLSWDGPPGLGPGGPWSTRGVWGHVTCARENLAPDQPRPSETRR